LSQIDASNARLENCLSVARWNVEKTYLRDLREQGISIVPTTWMMSPSVADLHELFDRFNSDDVVIKPIVGANADDAFWLRRETSAETFQIASETFQGRMALGQPFVRSVTGYGEISLIFFAGQYSHSVLKKPKAGDFRVQEEHGGRIQSVVPEASVIEFAHRTLQAVPGETLYARVDLVFLDDGQPAVMEVELIEPSLYLSYDRQSPVRFADAIEALLGR
jgi:glutathione synthase/RimK-type ligase-like ATP-grasp enzyme